MFDASPERLSEEVTAAVALRQMHNEVSTDLVKQYAGNYYREDWQPDDPVPENHAWEFIVNVMPSLIWTNPKARVSSRRPQAQANLVAAIRHGLNRWMADVGFDRIITEIAYDYLFEFGVCLTTLQPVPGYSGWAGMQPLRPVCHRISPRRSVIDPQALGPMNYRFIGHMWVKDREDLLNAKDRDGRPIYDRAAIAELADIDPREDLIRGPYGDSQLHSARGTVYREQVSGWDIYVPEQRKIYSIPAYTDGKGGNFYLREPRDYFGPPWGPYVMYGAYLVPDQIYPLSPLAASAEQVTELNAHAAAASRAAAREKQMVLVESSNETMSRAIKDGWDGHVYRVNGLTGQYAEVRLGGTTDTRMNYIALLRDRLDRNSGLTDVQRGNISGEATATEISVAEENRSSRMRFLRREFQYHTIQVLRTVSWFMYHSPSVVFNVPTEDGRDGLFVGGTEGLAELDPAQATAEFNDLELEIEPYSMEYVNQALVQKRAQDSVELIAALAPTMVQFPFINWRDVMDFWGEVMNHPDFAGFINFDALNQYVQKVQQSQLAGAPEPEDTDTTRAMEMIEQFKLDNPLGRRRFKGNINRLPSLMRNQAAGQGAGMLPNQLAASQQL